MPDQPDIGRLELGLKALASDTRLKIMQLLAMAECVPQELPPGADPRSRCGPGEICLNTIAQTLDLAAPTVSRHMAVLKAAGLVSARRSGQWVGFSIRREAIDDLGKQLRALRRLGGSGSGCR
jgi:ArsR family transcriptional regulator, arsenate/arsenite/antimonite-responsive transcriptional repressor